MEPGHHEQHQFVPDPSVGDIEDRASIAPGLVQGLPRKLTAKRDRSIDLRDVMPA